MSIILRCFHENPIIRTNVVLSGSPSESLQEEFTLTMEIESADSISRFWQAITVPFRLSVMYRVAVVFLTPPAPPTTAKQVAKYTLAVGPTTFPFAENGQIFVASSTSTFIPPIVAPGNPDFVTVDYSPALVTPGRRFFVNGAGLNKGTDYSGSLPNPGTSYRVYLLLPPDYKTEVEVTQWKALDSSPPGPIQSPDRVVLDLPATIGALPSNAPPPGVYSIRTGSDAPSDAITNRTNSTSFRVAARIDIPASPAEPILTQSAGIYTITGLGFDPENTEVFLETLALNHITSPPEAGQFNVVDAETITFDLPSGLPAGTYSVRVIVNGVESPPAVWISV